MVRARGSAPARSPSSALVRAAEQGRRAPGARVRLSGVSAVASHVLASTLTASASAALRSISPCLYSCFMMDCAACVDAPIDVAIQPP